MLATLGKLRLINSTEQARRQRLLVGSACALPLILLLAVSTGPASVSLMDMLLTDAIDETQRLILFEIRTPRALMTMTTGAGLAISGAILQALFKNPLADPGIIGVSSGAALAAALGIWLSAAGLLPGVLGTVAIPLMAFLGACLALLLLVVLAGGHKASTTLLILSGVAINTAAMTLLGMLILIVDDATLRQITFWSMGSYAGVGYPVFLLSLITIGPAATILWRKRRALMMMAVNEKQAAIAGVPTNKVKQITLIAVAAIVAVCVCFTGIVGFVGLVVPHICRMLVSSNLHVLLPLSAIIGAALVSVADIAARMLISPAEMPIGLITSFVGVPFFIALIYQQHRKHGYV